MTAYKTAAQDALDQAEIEDRDVMVDISIQYRYEDTPEVMRLVKVFDLKIISQNYDVDCSMEVKLKLRERKKFVEKIEFLKAIKIRIEANAK